MGKKGGFSKGLLFGSLIGAVLGLLYAPAPGVETRKKVKETAEDLKKKGEVAVREGVKKYKKVKVKAEPMVKRGLEETENFIEIATPKVKAASEKLSMLVDDVEDTVKKETKKIKKKFR